MILDEEEALSEILWPKLRRWSDLGNGKDHFVAQLGNDSCISGWGGIKSCGEINSAMEGFAFST